MTIASDYFTINSDLGDCNQYAQDLKLPEATALSPLVIQI